MIVPWNLFFFFFPVNFCLCVVVCLFVVVAVVVCLDKTAMFMNKAPF